MLNVRFIVKMLGVMFILETFLCWLLLSLAVPLSGEVMSIRFLFQAESLFGTGFLFYLYGL